MKRILVLLSVLGVGVVIGRLSDGKVNTAEAGNGEEKCSKTSGDIDANDVVDLSDAISLLGFMFLGYPTELPPFCEPPDLLAQIEELESQVASLEEELDVSRSTISTYQDRLGTCLDDLTPCQEDLTNCQGELKAAEAAQAEMLVQVEELQILLEKCYDENPPSFMEIPRTGQVTCYDIVGSFPDSSTVAVDCASAMCQGQDGSYQMGFPQTGRFKDNGDGTVTDTHTGLMWQQDVGGGGVRPFLWCQALSYCENLTLAGYDDWRLPNVLELQSLADYGRAVGPGINALFSVGTNSYWTSTSVASWPLGAYTVRFQEGFARTHNATKDNHFLDMHARAVRGPVSER